MPIPPAAPWSQPPVTRSPWLPVASTSSLPFHAAADPRPQTDAEIDELESCSDSKSAAGDTEVDELEPVANVITAASGHLAFPRPAKTGRRSPSSASATASASATPFASASTSAGSSKVPSTAGWLEAAALSKEEREFKAREKNRLAQAGVRKRRQDFMDSLEADHTVLVGTIEELRGENWQVRERVRSVQGESETLAGEIETWMDTVNELEGENGTLRENVERLGEENRTLVGERETLQVGVEAMQETIARLQKQLDEMGLVPLT